MSDVRLLLADDDGGHRALVAAQVAAVVAGVTVIEAGDGAEAVRIGFRFRPPIALLDVNMPRLSGLEVAIALRELRPDMRLALHTAEPLAQRERADDLRLPVFDKLQLERAVAWVERQVHEERRLGPGVAARTRKPSLRCSACGYGIATTAPPERCPMCHDTGAWTHASWRAAGVL